MTHRFTLEYWMDEGWYVGRLKQVPGVFSQGRTLEELEENIRDAYRLMLEAEKAFGTRKSRKGAKDAKDGRIAPFALLRASRALKFLAHPAVNLRRCLSQPAYPKEWTKYPKRF